MKRSLGKIIALLCLCLLTLLQADDIAYRLQSDTNTTYRHAPVHLDVDLNQTDPSKIILFELTPHPSPRYRIIQIDALHDDTPHHTHHRYRFELYPLQSGDINVTFRLLKRITDDRKMAFSASGDRDDYKKLETVDVPVALPPIRLHVHPLPPNTQLVGRYKLSYRVPKERGEAFEPMSVTVRIQGEGFPPLLPRLFDVPRGVTRFAQKPTVKRIITPQGIRYDARYTLAFSSASSFTLPPLTLRAFDPKRGQTYDLSVPALPFTITPVAARKHLDRTDTPPPLVSPMETLRHWWRYALAFLAGFLSAWIVLRLKRTHQTTKEDSNGGLLTAIDATRDTQSLYRLLLSADARRFASVLRAIEQGETNLKTLKSQAKESL